MGQLTSKEFYERVAKLYPENAIIPVINIYGSKEYTLIKIAYIDDNGDVKSKTILINELATNCFSGLGEQTICKFKSLKSAQRDTLVELLKYIDTYVNTPVEKRGFEEYMDSLESKDAEDEPKEEVPEDEGGEDKSLDNDSDWEDEWDDDDDGWGEEDIDGEDGSEDKDEPKPSDYTRGKSFHVVAKDEYGNPYYYGIELTKSPYDTQSGKKNSVTVTTYATANLAPTYTEDSYNKMKSDIEHTMGIRILAPVEDVKRLVRRLKENTNGR